jgi:outer membrane protein TolC
VLLGAQPGTYRAELSAVAAIPSAPPIADAGGPAELIRRRPDLVVAEQRLRASNARIGSALSEYYPKVSLSGLVGTATTTLSTAFQDPATQAQGVLGLRWRLFDFVRVGAEVKAAKGRHAEALAAYQQSVLRATEEVEDAFSSLVKREAQERTLAEGDASLTKARAAAEAAYRGGAVSLIEVLDADARLLALRDARAQARTEAARAAIRSFRALGGGWRDPQMALDDVGHDHVDKRTGL